MHEIWLAALEARWYWLSWCWTHVLISSSIPKHNSYLKISLASQNKTKKGPNWGSYLRKLICQAAHISRCCCTYNSATRQHNFNLTKFQSKYLTYAQLYITVILCNNLASILVSCGKAIWQPQSTPAVLLWCWCVCVCEGMWPQQLTSDTDKMALLGLTTCFRCARTVHTFNYGQMGKNWKVLKLQAIK